LARGQIGTEPHWKVHYERAALAAIAAGAAWRASKPSA
jgi:hypothetical protein